MLKFLSALIFIHFALANDLQNESKESDNVPSLVPINVKKPANVPRVIPINMKESLQVPKPIAVNEKEPVLSANETKESDNVPKLIPINVKKPANLPKVIPINIKGSLHVPKLIAVKEPEKEPVLSANETMKPANVPQVITINAMESTTEPVPLKEKSKVPDKATFLQVARNRSSQILKIKSDIPSNLLDNSHVFFHFVWSIHNLINAYKWDMRDNVDKHYLLEYSHSLVDDTHFVTDFVDVLIKRNAWIIQQLTKSTEEEVAQLTFWKIMWHILRGPLWKFY